MPHLEIIALLPELLDNIERYDAETRYRINIYRGQVIADPVLNYLAARKLPGPAISLPPGFKCYNDKNDKECPAPQDNFSKSGPAAEDSRGKARSRGCGSGKDGLDAGISHKMPESSKAVKIDLSNAWLLINEEKILLTAVEARILQLLYRHKEQLVSREQIAAAATDDYTGLTWAEPKYHIRRLRQKMGDDGKHPQYIKTRRGLGYCLTGPVYAEAGRQQI